MKFNWVWQYCTANSYSHVTCVCLSVCLSVSVSDVYDDMLRKISRCSELVKLSVTMLSLASSSSSSSSSASSSRQQDLNSARHSTPDTRQSLDNRQGLDCSLMSRQCLDIASTARSPARQQDLNSARQSTADSRQGPSDTRQCLDCSLVSRQCLDIATSTARSPAADTGSIVTCLHPDDTNISAVAAAKSLNADLSSESQSRLNGPAGPPTQLSPTIATLLPAGIVTLIVSVCTLDQELISYRYSSCSCCWADLSKNLRLRRFKLDRDVIWHDCCSSKYASIDAVCFPIWHDNSGFRPWHHFVQKSGSARWIITKHLSALTCPRL